MGAAITREDLDAGRVDLADVIDPGAERLPPVNPGRILREEFLRPHRLSAATVAAAMGVPRNRLTEIINGRRAITADTALDAGMTMGLSVVALEVAGERQTLLGGSVTRASGLASSATTCSAVGTSVLISITVSQSPSVQGRSAASSRNGPRSNA